MHPPNTSPGKALRRVAQVVGIVVAAVLMVGLLVVGGVLTVARTSWGSERLRRLVLPRVNAALAGQLDVRHFRFLGDRVVVDGLLLRDPEGDLVARVARVDVTFSPWQLLSKRLDLRAVSVGDPLLLFRHEKDGDTNLARALAARQPQRAVAPPAAGGGGQERAPLAIRLERLVITGGTIDVRDERADAAPAARHLRVEGVEARASGHYGDGDGAFGMHLDVNGDAAAPVREPLALSIDAKGSLPRVDPGAAQARPTNPAGQQATQSLLLPCLGADARIAASLGDSSIQLTGDVQATAPEGGGSGGDRCGGTPRVSGRVNIQRLRIMPALVRLVAPTSALKAPVALSGAGTLDGATRKLAANLNLAAGGATVAIKGAGDLARESIDGLSVRARDIDLGRLVTGGSPSHISFDLDAHGQGHSLSTLRGAATFHLPPGRLGGYAIGPIRLRADADRGRYKVMDLVAVIPGVNLSGAGEATGQAVAFRGAIDVRDLSATVRSLTAGAPGGSPRASGRGRIDIALAGKPNAPALHIKGHLVGLGWQDVRMPTLDVTADIPDVRVPLAASLDLNVPQVDAGARHFRGLAVTLRAAGPRFDGRLSLTAPEALALDVAGVWGPAHGEIGFQKVVLRSRHATWRSVKPMRLLFGGDVLRIAELDWRTDDGQQLRVDLEKRAAAVRAEVVLSAIDLAKLPESLLPPTLRLAGRLDADVRAQGRLERPTVVARATLKQGRVGPVRDIAFSTAVRLSGQRLTGDLDLGALGARLAGTFDLPVVWPPPAGAAVVADLRATNIDLRRVATGLTGAREQVASGNSIVVAAKPPLDVRGTATWNVKLSGTGAHPELSLGAEVRQLKIDGTTTGDVTVQIEAPANRPITARLELGRLMMAGGSAGDATRGSATTATPGAASDRPTGAAADVDRSVLSLRTGFSLGSLINHPPSRKALLSTPLHLQARLRGVQLAPLAALAGRVGSGKLGGTASLDADLDGTPETARGTIALTVMGAHAGRFPATDGVVHVALGERDVRADARISRRGATLFSLGARVEAPVARLLRPDRPDGLADVPIELHAALGPLDLQRVGLPPETDRQPARILKGRLRAQADITGSLRAPRVNVRADADDLRLDQTPIGAAVVLVSYANRTAGGDVMLQSSNGGRLHLVASAQADLGYPAILRGLDPARISVKGRVDAKGFDLAGLSGATPGLRTVAGQLFAGVGVTGTAADPRVSGRLEWKDGGLTVTGMGEYKRIHLLAHGDEDHIFLDELRADSGGGRARITASGDHRVGQGYAIKAALDLDQFPAYVEGQALAALSLQAKADTQVSVQQIRAKVSIDSARLALSDAKRRHLQKLAPPADVVLTEGNDAINAAQARKLAAVNAALARPEEKPGQMNAAAQGQNGKQDGKPDGKSHAPAGEKPAGVVVLVDAPRNLWVSGKDANIELGLQPGFRVEISEVTRVFGQVIIKRGRVDVVGRRFDVKADSTARFSGPPDRPELDVSATHKNEQENITVLVTVKGSPGHLQIGITAPDRPDLTETQLYTLIVTGRLTFGGGSASSATPTDRAASLVGGLVAAQLQKTLSKKLPFDVLTIEAGNGLGAARLEAGTYLTSDLYVGYVGRLGADPALLQNRNAVHLEYELGAHWSFQGEYGDAKTGSADVIWTKRY